MKRFLIGLSLFAVACSGASPTAPSSSSGSGQTTQATADPSNAPSTSGPTVDPAPPVPGANAAVPQFTLSGPQDPSNCFSAGMTPMQWALNVSDAGPKALRFVAISQHDDTPGCESTEKNPRTWVTLGGVSDYTPHSSGHTTFTFDPKAYTCGRVQVDVSIFDASGHEILIVGIMINYGSTCTPPPPPPPPSAALECKPLPQSGDSLAQSVLVGQSVGFAASGGTGTYSWSTPGGSPVTGSGSSFTTSYANSGSYIATVASGDAKATCPVTVTAAVTPELVCTPATQETKLGIPVTLSAAGGTGSYSWSAPGGSSATGSGSSFTTSFATEGTSNVTVTSGSLSRVCQVVVQAPPPPPIPREKLVCAAATQNVLVGQMATVSAVGGTFSYSWSAPGGSSMTGTGSSFSTSYSTAGSNIITVTSGNETATCEVNVPPLACSPNPLTVEIGVSLTLTASGGTGAYSWSAPNSYTETANTPTLTTGYILPATNIVTLTSGSASVTCTVTSVCPSGNQPTTSGRLAPMTFNGCPAR